jgi:hypothetical protein
MVAAHDGWPPRLRDFARLVTEAPDEAVVQFAVAISDLLARLQADSLEACWAFAHEGPDAPASVLPTGARDAVANAGRALANSVKNSRTPPWNPELSRTAVTQLVAAIHEKGITPAVQGLRPGADHALFCSSFHTLIEVALALPASQRVNVLRAILSGGGRSI